MAKNCRKLAPTETRLSAGLRCLVRMVRQYQPCIPTRGTKVPAGPDWLHEIKMDGYRLLVEREGRRVRLITRNGYDWTDRFPWIVEAALKNKQQRFVIDGEAVVLGVDAISDFNALHSRKHNEEVQLTFGLACVHKHCQVLAACQNC